MNRKQVVAGTFYPGSSTELKSAIDGMIETGAEKEPALGIICPHAGYIYSGRVAVAVISRVLIPDTVIIMGPNHTGLGAPFAVWPSGAWETPLGSVEVDAGLAQSLITGSASLTADTLAHEHEHAIEVQLPLLQYFKPEVKIVPITLAQAPTSVMADIGREIAAVIAAGGRDVLIMASSDMTHYESQASAERKDKAAIEAILKLDEYDLGERVARTGISMCGYAPVSVLLAACKEMGDVRGELVSYRTSGDASGDYSSVVGYAGIAIRRNQASPLVKLARETIENYVKNGQGTKPPTELSAVMRQKAGVFVSIHENGELRGCIGTFEPSRASVAEEVIANAISAATDDPRFDPVTAEELPDLDISVDVLSRPEPVTDVGLLNPKKYGLIVQRGWRRGLLLPDLEGVDTPDQQIDICRRKGDIGPDEPVNLYRFEVKRYH